MTTDFEQQLNKAFDILGQSQTNEVGKVLNFEAAQMLRRSFGKTGVLDFIIFYLSTY